MLSLPISVPGLKKKALDLHTFMYFSADESFNVAPSSAASRSFSLLNAWFVGSSVEEIFFKEIIIKDNHNQKAKDRNDRQNTVVCLFVLVNFAKIIFAKILHFEIINKPYFLVITFHFQGVAH